MSRPHTQYYITPPQRHKLFKSLCRASEFYNYTFLNRWLVGVRISLSSERSSQIKKRLECLWLEQRELKNRMQRKMMGKRHGNTSREVATGSLTASSLVWLLIQTGNECQISWTVQLFWWVSCVKMRQKLRPNADRHCGQWCCHETRPKTQRGTLFIMFGRRASVKAPPAHPDAFRSVTLSCCNKLTAHCCATAGSPLGLVFKIKVHCMSAKKCSKNHIRAAMIRLWTMTITMVLFH